MRVVGGRVTRWRRHRGHARPQRARHSGVCVRQNHGCWVVEDTRSRRPPILHERNGGGNGDGRGDGSVYRSERMREIGIDSPTSPPSSPPLKLVRHPAASPLARGRRRAAVRIIQRVKHPWNKQITAAVAARMTNTTKATRRFFTAKKQNRDIFCIEKTIAFYFTHFSSRTHDKRVKTYFF